MTELSILVSAGDDGLPVRHIALSRLYMSNGQFKRAKFEGEVLLDGMPVHADIRVKAGQRLTVRVPESVPAPINPCALSLSIPYRDAHLLVVDKPAPLASAPSRVQDTPTLQNAVYAYLDCPEGFVYRPVNRLDKGTSGLMAVALSAHAQQRLQSMLHTDAYVREYLAVCEGTPDTMEGTVCQPIAKAEGATIRRQVSPEGKEAVTHYKVLQQVNGRSLLLLHLQTGRTHQCRVHMQWLGCPIVGDFLYGTEHPSLPGRFALHSHRLAVLHPMTGETLLLESPLPEVLKQLLGTNGAW